MIRAFFPALLLASLAAPAAEPALDSNGIALGADLAAFRGNPRFECAHVGKPIADDICNLALGQTARIGSVPVTQMLLYFYRDKLHTLAIFFEPTHFADVSAALERRYGPGESARQTLRNSKGDTLENEIRRWRKAQTTLEVSRYAGRQSLSRLTSRTDFAVAEFERRTRASSSPNQSK